MGGFIDHERGWRAARGETERDEMRSRENASRRSRRNASVTGEPGGAEREGGELSRFQQVVRMPLVAPKARTRARARGYR